MVLFGTNHDLPAGRRSSFSAFKTDAFNDNKKKKKEERDASTRSCHTKSTNRLIVPPCFVRLVRDVMFIYTILHDLAWKKRKRKGETGVNRQFRSFHAGFLFFLFFLRLGEHSIGPQERFGSMRAQMGLCLMKFGPSCTCHFRGISRRRDGRYTASSTVQEIGGNHVPRPTSKFDRAYAISCRFDLNTRNYRRLKHKNFYRRSIIKVKKQKGCDMIN